MYIYLPLITYQDETHEIFQMTAFLVYAHLHPKPSVVGIGNFTVEPVCIYWRLSQLLKFISLILNFVCVVFVNNCIQATATSAV
jgi:hypothetical protein